MLCTIRGALQLQDISRVATLPSRFQPPPGMAVFRLLELGITMPFPMMEKRNQECLADKMGSSVCLFLHFACIIVEPRNWIFLVAVIPIRPRIVRPDTESAASFRLDLLRSVSMGLGSSPVGGNYVVKSLLKQPASDWEV